MATGIEAAEQAPGVFLRTLRNRTARELAALDRLVPRRRKLARLIAAIDELLAAERYLRPTASVPPARRRPQRGSNWYGIGTTGDRHSLVGRRRAAQ